MISGERRDVVSLYGELRFMTWAGVMLIVWGVGVLLSKHLDKIGPLAIAIAIGAASLACYGYSFWRKRTGRHHLADDFILLLAALLASADLGYIESQFHLLGDDWQRHFLILALLHAAAAYAFGSRAVLSLSIAALAAYIGIEQREALFFHGGAAFAARAFIAAAVVLVWRLVQRKPEFTPVFDHAAANLAFWGAIVLTNAYAWRYTGLAIALVLAGVSAWHGRRLGEKAFVVYAWIYGTIAVDVFVGNRLLGAKPIAIWLAASTIAAIVGLFVTLARMRKAEA